MMDTRTAKHSKTALCAVLGGAREPLARSIIKVIERLRSSSNN